MKEILVTTALPYANGPLHLGHILEHIQSDIWVRINRMLGHTCYFVCGSDAHGTPIMLAAEAKNTAPETLAANYQQEHKETLLQFGVQYDEFYTTHSSLNYELVTAIFDKLTKNKAIEIKEITQFFDPEKNMFLPDRLIKGTCPKCKASDQYGDNCEICGAHYRPTELIEPRSAISTAIPILKSSTHYFFILKHYQPLLEEWLNKNSNIIPQAVHNKLQEWFSEELKSWDISRDAPYFGFLIPNTEDKYFYVWLDAPIGYMAACKKMCQERNIDFNKFFAKDATCELYHFIGKDISYFHTIFWPAVLLSANLRLPTKFMIHGYLSINGDKMSKSRGTFITGKQYLKVADPELLRYYFASKLMYSIDDIDLNFNEFVKKINSDLVSKFINLASRSIVMLEQNFSLQLASALKTEPLYLQFLEQQTLIKEHYIDGDTAKAIKVIMHLADLANKYFNDHKPWELIRKQTSLTEAQQILTMAINMFRILTIYLQPILPILAAKIKVLLNCDLNWYNINQPLVNIKINPYQHLLTRLDLESFTPLLAKNTDNSQNNTPQIAPLISIADLNKVDLRIAKILQAEEVTGSDKLLKLTVDLGTEKRIIFSGIKKFYHPKDLINKLTVVVANLEPRTMRFGVSSGMLLVAVNENKLLLLEPNQGAEPGMKIQ